MTPEESLALDSFTDYMVRNYPGPDTIISDPAWHAPRIFRAAMHALSSANAATLKAAQGGVTEAMVERYKVLHQEGMDRHVESERAAGRTPQLQSAIDAGIRHALAALSAEPAAQGEEGFDARKYVRHMADVLEAGGDLFKVDADLLRLAAAINKAWEQRKRKQPAERVPEGWMLVPIKPTQAMIDAMEACEYPLNAWDEALAATPAAPPAQPVDPTDPGTDVSVLREQVRHLERRIHELHAQPAERVPDGSRSGTPTWFVSRSRGWPCGITFNNLTAALDHIRKAGDENTALHFWIEQAERMDYTPEQTRKMAEWSAAHADLSGEVRELVEADREYDAAITAKWDAQGIKQQQAAEKALAAAKARRKAAHAKFTQYREPSK